MWGFFVFLFFFSEEARQCFFLFKLLIWVFINYTSSLFIAFKDCSCNNCLALLILLAVKWRSIVEMIICSRKRKGVWLEEWDSELRRKNCTSHLHDLSTWHLCSCDLIFKGVPLHGYHCLVSQTGPTMSGQPSVTYSCFGGQVAALVVNLCLL